MLNLSDKKILVFSDCHLSCKFDKKWFETVEKLINEHDLVIINGDFWEYKSCELKDFFHSEWKDKLFPLLKEKTIFIFGNHDEKKNFYKYVYKFSFEAKEKIEFISGDKKFVLEHGHKFLGKKRKKVSLFAKIVGKLKKWKTFYLFLRSLEESRNPFFYPIVRFIHKCNINRREELEEKIKKKENKIDKNTILIFGHIHKPKHDLKNNYIILGAFKNGHKRYLSIKKGKITFVNKRIK